VDKVGCLHKFFITTGKHISGEMSLGHVIDVLPLEVFLTGRKHL